MCLIFLFTLCSVLSEIILEGTERSDAYSGLLNVIQMQPSLVTPDTAPPVGPLSDAHVGVMLFLKGLFPSWQELTFDEGTTEGADCFLRIRQAIIALRGYYQSISTSDKGASILITLFSSLEDIFPV